MCRQVGQGSFRWREVAVPGAWPRKGRKLIRGSLLLGERSRVSGTVSDTADQGRLTERMPQSESVPRRRTLGRRCQLPEVGGTCRNERPRFRPCGTVVGLVVGGTAVDGRPGSGRCGGVGAGWVGVPCFSGCILRPIGLYCADDIAAVPLADRMLTRRRAPGPSASRCGWRHYHQRGCGLLPRSGEPRESLEVVKFRASRGCRCGSAAVVRAAVWSASRVLRVPVGSAPWARGWGRLRGSELVRGLTPLPSNVQAGTPAELGRGRANLLGQRPQRGRRPGST